MLFCVGRVSLEIFGTVIDLGIDAETYDAVVSMSVADGIKYIVSLGAVPPENAGGVQAAFKAEAARMLSDG